MWCVVVFTAGNDGEWWICDQRDQHTRTHTHTHTHTHTGRSSGAKNEKTKKKKKKNNKKQLISRYQASRCGILVQARDYTRMSESTQHTDK